MPTDAPPNSLGVCGKQDLRDSAHHRLAIYCDFSASIKRQEHIEDDSDCGLLRLLIVVAEYCPSRFFHSYHSFDLTVRDFPPLSPKQALLHCCAPP